MAKKKIDATQGPLIPLIFSYTIPLILTTLIQHFFDLVDKAVLGNMADTTAVAAVGATGSITSLVINGFVGLSAGASIVLARYVGQRDEAKMRKTIDTALTAGFGFGIVVAIIGILFAPFFLNITNCPEECYEGALIYIRIYVGAAPATLLYNYGSAILRTLGDTRRPLTYITVSGVSNAVLNVILCLILPQKVAAVAIATAASKVIAGALVLNRLCHFEDAARVSLRRLHLSLASFGQILRFGIPNAITTLIYPVANLQITPAINSFGVDAVAGSSASGSLTTLVQSVGTGFSTATSTFMGQNIGAENKERVKKSFWYCFSFNVLIMGSLGLLLALSGRFWLRIVIGSASPAAIDYGMVRMRWLSAFLFVNAAINVLRHALLAYGYPFFGSLSSIFFTLGFRVFWMQLIYPLRPTFTMIMVCFTVSWTLNMLFYLPIVLVLNRRYDRGIYKKI